MESRLFQGIRQIFLWIIQILDFSASGQASLVAASTASAGASTLLWTKTQQLPEEAFRQLHSIYSDHFPIEARHHLAGTYFFQVYMIFLKEMVFFYQNPPDFGKRCLPRWVSSTPFSVPFRLPVQF